MSEPGVVASLSNRSGGVPRLLCRALEWLCAAGLATTIGGVFLGLFLRARFEHSYVLAIPVALAALATMLIAWVQQIIAARDAATWRDMVSAQIEAAEAETAVEESEFGHDSIHDAYVTAALIGRMKAAMRSGG